MNEWLPLGAQPRRRRKRGHEWLDESLRNKNYALDSREI